MLRYHTHHRATFYVGIFTVALFGMAAAQAGDTPTRREAVTAGGHVNETIVVREHAGWNAACDTIASPALMLDAPPHHGRVCARVETIIVRSLYAGTEDQCIGKRVRGVRLEYRPDAGFSGDDELRYAVQYPSVRRAITVSVTVVAEGAAQPVAAALPMPPRQTAGSVPPCMELVF
ncbi:hypothetical protein MXD81_63480 [Microbacteriaceae bacterium K1510]|nr:hypothetical protein [Microbacteriaceae bacterium K1510]